MRILIYGFKPYGSYTENISEKLLARLSRREGLVKHVFDVRFDAAMFNTVLARVKPEYVLGLGQHPRAHKLRIERRARNQRIKPDRSLIPISRTGPSSVFASLSLPSSAQTTLTYNAGTYVCNYSMYMTARYCRRTGARFGFIHIPKDHDLKKLSAYLQTVLAWIEQQRIQD